MSSDQPLLFGERGRELKKRPAHRRREISRLEQGLNPLVGTAGPDGETCGSCQHLERHRYANTYFKCGLGPKTGGPGTDLRLKWPACHRWEGESS